MGFARPLLGYVAWSVIGWALTVDGRAEGGPAVDGFATRVKPVLAQYCLRCHGGKEPAGDLPLDQYQSAASLAAHPDHWRHVVQQIESGGMPPEKEPKPSAEQIRGMVTWINDELRRISLSRPVNPGRVTLRRLNRTEYNNTIRDLFGVSIRPADQFPEDDTGYGFDTIGDVLSLSPVLMERCMLAAKKVAETVIRVDDPHARRAETYPQQRLESTVFEQPRKHGALFLHSTGEAFATIEVPVNGRYSVTIRAAADQAGDALAKMAIRLDGKAIHLFDVSAEPPAFADYENTMEIKQGEHRLSAVFLNDFVDPKATDPKRNDRNLYIERFVVDGPIGLTPAPLPEAHRRILPEEPKGDRKGAIVRAALERLATRAYRRPVTKDEVDGLVRLVELAEQKGEKTERGIRLAVQAILVSPHFLFRVELDPEGLSAASKQAVSPHELASRLSYFLWSTLPDEALRRAADDGSLAQPEVLRAQVRRMLADPNIRGLIENFTGQWLETRRLDIVTPDLKLFKTFDEALRQAMRQETEEFVAYLIREDRSILDLLDADYTFVNERLARHYGLPEVKGKDFRKVSLSTLPRRGVWTQAGVLTVTSNPTRTSPVKRGKWILEVLLGTPPPSAPPNVPALVEEGKVAKETSLRARMEQHRANPACASCHRRMDPLGFGLENFDGIGSWRDKDGPVAVDASGQLPDGKKFNGPLELTKILKEKKDLFRRCLADKMLTYALGRGMDDDDEPTLSAVVEELKKREDRFSALVESLVLSEPFRYRRVESR